MTLEAVKTQLRDFFADSFPGRELADDDDIFDLGFGNSLFAMELVEYVESAFQIAIESDDLDVDNFRSIDRIAGLVGRKSELRLVG